MMSEYKVKLTYQVPIKMAKVISIGNGTTLIITSKSKQIHDEISCPFLHFVSAKKPPKSHSTYIFNQQSSVTR